MVNILLVEDDLEICEILQFFLLKAADYNVTVLHNAQQALQIIQVRQFDIVLLDIMLQEMNGIDLCKELRKISYCPVIFISCINDNETIIQALSMGGDDYLVKPFQAPVLLARIEANLRRIKMIQQDETPQIIVGELKLETATHTIRKRGKAISLSPTEYEILHFLMQNKHRFVTFDEIYQAVWQRPSLGDVRALFVHISHLRQKIEDNPSQPSYIRTHMRGGYILADSFIMQET